MIPAPATSTGEPPADAASSGDRRLLRAGILGAAAAFVGLSFLGSLTIKPFLPADESLNVYYALSVSQGRIPRINRPVVPQIPGQRHLPINYVANHPPLYFLLAGVPLRLSLDRGHPMLGFYAARLLTVLLAVGAVVFTGILAAVGTRRRPPAVAVGAAALVATSGSLVLHSAIVHNDGPATALVAAELVASVLVLRQGLRTDVCLLLIASACLGLLTRVSAVSAVALSAAALVTAALLHPVGGWRRALLRAVAWVCALAAACVLTSGWFYWHNLRLYGDPTAQAYATKLVTRNRSIHRPFTEFLLHPRSYWHEALRMFGADVAVPNGLPFKAITPAVWTIAAIWFAVAVGLVLAGVRAARARRRPADRQLLVQGAVTALLALQVLAVFLQVASHVAVGGFPHVRYLFPAWPVVAMVMAYGILSIPGLLGRALLALAVLMQAVLTASWFVNQAAMWTGGAGLGEVPKAVRLSGVPAPHAVLAALAVVVIAGLGLAVAAILRGGSGGEVAAAPTGPRREPTDVRTPAGS